MQQANLQDDQQPGSDSPVKLKSHGGKRQNKNSSANQDKSLNSTRNSERPSVASHNSDTDN